MECLGKANDLQARSTIAEAANRGSRGRMRSGQPGRHTKRSPIARPVQTQTPWIAMAAAVCIAPRLHAAATASSARAQPVALPCAARPLLAPLGGAALAPTCRQSLQQRRQASDRCRHRRRRLPPPRRARRPRRPPRLPPRLLHVHPLRRAADGGGPGGAAVRLGPAGGGDGRGRHAAGRPVQPQPARVAQGRLGRALHPRGGRQAAILWCRKTRCTGTPAAQGHAGRHQLRRRQQPGRSPC